MTKLFFAVFIMAASTLMGICVLIVLTVPELAAKDSELILPAAGLGFVLGLPVAWVIAKKINTLFKKS